MFLSGLCNETFCRPINKMNTAQCLDMLKLNNYILQKYSSKHSNLDQSKTIRIRADILQQATKYRWWRVTYQVETGSEGKGTETVKQVVSNPEYYSKVEYEGFYHRSYYLINSWWITRHGQQKYIFLHMDQQWEKLMNFQWLSPDE